MSITSISDLAHQRMLNILGYSNQAGQSGGASAASSSLSMGGSTATQLSPFAQMLSELQQVEASNPGQYAKLSQQISTNLASAASTAQTRGNTALAKQLSTLSKDFSTAAQTGQLPNIGDLEKAMHSSGISSAMAVDAGAAQLTGKHSTAVNILGQVLSLAGI